MSGVEWPEEAREAAQEAAQRDVRRLARKAPEDGTDEDGYVLRIADRILAALAPHVAAREARARAEGERAAIVERDAPREERDDWKARRDLAALAKVAAAEECVSGCSPWPTISREPSPTTSRRPSDA